MVPAGERWVTGEMVSDRVVAPFVRDRLTWLADIGVATYAFCLYALGPAQAFIHQELHLSYTVTSLHSTLWAAGSVATGLTFHTLARRLGRHRLFWLSAAATVAGTLLFAIGHLAAVTLTAAVVLGTGGSFLQAGCTVLLADRHGSRRDRAIIEANIGASVAAVIVPALLGFLAATAAGWRAGMLLPALALAVLFLVLRRQPMPQAMEFPAGTSARLPRGFWGLCVLASLTVAIEFCIVFYGIPLLRSDVGLATADAAQLMSLFFVGELVGRVAGARLTRRPGRAKPVIQWALLTALAGFLVLWLCGSTLLAGIALFVTGAGIGNLYPLTVALVLGASGGRTDLAMARVQVALGLAIAVAPLVLGLLADSVGVHSAFALELVLILGAVFLLAPIRVTHGDAAVTDVTPE